jgi:hypothetical protein
LPGGTVTRKRMDRGTAPGFVGKEVKAAAIGPEMAGEDVLGHEVDVILKPGADAGKKCVKHAAHRKDRGACIDRACIRGQGTHLAAGARVPFQHRDG